MYVHIWESKLDLAIHPGILYKSNLDQSHLRINQYYNPSQQILCFSFQKFQNKKKSNHELDEARNQQFYWTASDSTQILTLFMFQYNTDSRNL